MDEVVNSNNDISDIVNDAVMLNKLASNASQAPPPNSQSSKATECPMLSRTAPPILQFSAASPPPPFTHSHPPPSLSSTPYETSDRLSQADGSGIGGISALTGGNSDLNFLNVTDPNETFKDTLNEVEKKCPRDSLSKGPSPNVTPPSKNLKLN